MSDYYLKMTTLISRSQFDEIALTRTHSLNSKQSQFNAHTENARSYQNNRHMKRMQHKNILISFLMHFSPFISQMITFYYDWSTDMMRDHKV